MTLDIKRLKQLGAGTEAEVFCCKVKNMPGKFVDKRRIIYNNADLADKTMKRFIAEFSIAKDLVHPNIVEYKYFMKKYIPDED